MNIRIIHIFALFLMLSLIALFSSCSNYKSSAQQFNKEIQDKLNKAVDTKMAEFKVPGAIIGVWVPGKGEWVACKGVANLSTGEAPQISDHVRIASITKTFTATVILQLADERKLSLNDTLSKYDIGISVPGSEKITIRRLLNMTSDLNNYTADNERFWTKFLADTTAPWAPKQLIEIANANKAISNPGNKYIYNNTNYILLGMIIEKVTGNTADKEITTRIINKLSLKNTSFPKTAIMPSPFMHGYMPDINVTRGEIGGPAVIDMSIETPTPFFTAGAMISTLMDLRTWLSALTSGKLLSPEMHKEQMNFTAPNNPEYGLGVMHGGTLIGHSGEVIGYNSSAYTEIGGKGATIIVLVNRYPSLSEGVSDQIMIEIYKIIRSLI